MWEFLQKLKQLQPESKNIVLTGLTGEAFGEKALVSNGKLVWASVAGGFLEQHDQQIEQLEVNGIALVDGEKIFGEVIGGQKKIVICGGGHVSMPIIQLGRQIGCYVTVLEDRPKFADNARRAGAGTGAGAILQRVCQEGDQPRFQRSLRVRQGREQELYADLHQLQLHQERAGCLRRNGRRRRQSEEPPVLQESELQHRRLRCF